MATTAPPPAVTEIPPQSAEAAATDDQTAVAGGAAAEDGMRREWNFTFHVKHQAARTSVRYNPAWVSQFIDPDDIIKLNKLDRDIKHCPLMPFIAYTDQTIAVQSGAFWEDCPKVVKLLYSHIPHGMALVSYCKQCVQHVLQDPRVLSVDGHTSLHRLTVGKKLRNVPKLGGRSSFHFSYVLADKIRARTEYVYCIGTIAGQRGYLITVNCNKEQELQGYVKNFVLPHFRDASKFVVDVDVAYEEVTNNVLKEQQELYGEMHFYDKDAAVSFALPMHPVRVRPDFSPIQSVGVGSIACMTLELDVNQKLMDDFAEADITGMPKYKVNHVLLFLDVEDVARMGYPGLMSVEQYSSAKIKRLIEVFKDAKTVGSPISLYLGPRCGRSATVTFTYEGFGAVVKAMLVSTLVGNMGITALYFTKLGGGLFDAHLYLYQQLLKSVVFRPPREISERFSRYNAVQIRLTDQDLPRCYATAPVSEKKTMERHLKSLHQSTDGRTDGGKMAVIDPSKGGLVRTAAHPGNVADGGSGESGEDLVEMVVTEVAGDEPESTAADDATEISVTSIPHLASLPAWDDQSPPPPPRALKSTTAMADNESAAAAKTSGDQGHEVAATSPGVSPGADLDSEVASTVLSGDEGRPGTATSGAGDDRNPSPSSPKITRSVASPQQQQEGTAPPTAAQTVVDQQQLIQNILKEDEELYFGPSLHDVYIRCCELQRCRPNSYLLKKLPSSPRFTMTVEELDLTSNYLGHNGFVAVLQLLEHLPRLHSVFFNDMSLDNADVEHLCEVLSNNTSIRSVQLRNNPKITLPATKQLTRLLRANKRITSIGLHGTRIGSALIASLEEEANRNKTAQPSTEIPKGETSTA